MNLDNKIDEVNSLLKIDVVSIDENMSKEFFENICKEGKAIWERKK